MMHQCELSLRAWDPEGTGVSRDTVLHRLKVDGRSFKTVGTGGWWKTIRIIVLDLVAGIDQDLFDLQWESKLLGELGRLGLNLEIVTND
jgi:hypothetical protein